MRLRIEDYTIAATTKADILNRDGDQLHTGLPVVTYTYKPALPEALAVWRFDHSHATCGKDELSAAATLVADHIASWDVVGDDDRPLPITMANVRRIPEVIANQLFTTITTWAPPPAVETPASA